MSKRNTDESLRKPRVFSGTPMNRLINLIALGLFACSGLTWALYEMWPQSRKLHKSISEGKFDDTPEMKFRLDSMRYMMKDPTYYDLIVKMQKRTFERERPLKEKPWLIESLEPFLIFKPKPESVNSDLPDVAQDQQKVEVINENVAENEIVFEEVLDVAPETHEVDMSIENLEEADNEIVFEELPHVFEELPHIAPEKRKVDMRMVYLEEDDLVIIVEEQPDVAPKRQKVEVRNLEGADAVIVTEDLPEQREEEEGEENSSKRVVVYEIDENQCFSCRMTFLSRAKLLEHRNVKHSGRKLFSCTYYQKEYPSSDYLKTHYLVRHRAKNHNQQGFYSCSVCNYYSITTRGMMRHAKIQHASYVDHIDD